MAYKLVKFEELDNGGNLFQELNYNSGVVMKYIDSLVNSVSVSQVDPVLAVGDSFDVLENLIKSGFNVKAFIAMEPLILDSHLTPAAIHSYQYVEQLVIVNPTFDQGVRMGTNDNHSTLYLDFPDIKTLMIFNDNDSIHYTYYTTKYQGDDTNYFIFNAINPEFKAISIHTLGKCDNLAVHGGRHYRSMLYFDNTLLNTNTPKRLHTDYAILHHMDRKTASEVFSGLKSGQLIEIKLEVKEDTQEAINNVNRNVMGFVSSDYEVFKGVSVGFSEGKGKPYDLLRNLTSINARSVEVSYDIDPLKKPTVIKTGTLIREEKEGEIHIPSEQMDKVRGATPEELYEGALADVTELEKRLKSNPTGDALAALENDLSIAKNMVLKRGKELNHSYDKLCQDLKIKMPEIDCKKFPIYIGMGKNAYNRTKAEDIRTEPKKGSKRVRFEGPEKS